MERANIAALKAAAVAAQALKFKEQMGVQFDEAYDFDDKRLIVVAAFANLNALAKGKARSIAVKNAAAAHSVSANFVWKHGLDRERLEGFFTESTWGKHSKTPWKLSDIEVFNKCKNYCRDNNGHRRDQPNLTASTFAKWLKKEFDINVSFGQAAVYLGRLGGTWQSVKKGCYVDSHESKRAIQHEREFLREYKVAYDRGASTSILALTLALAPSSRPRAWRSPLDLVPRPLSSPSPSPSPLDLVPRPLSSPSPWTSCLALTLALAPKVPTSSTTWTRTFARTPRIGLKKN